jgi:hypothetical protein
VLTLDLLTIQGSGSRSFQTQTLDAQTDAGIEAMNQQYASNKQKVIDMLVGLVTDVHIDVPKARR